jgi:outer membrane protein, multidrug efflux system
MDMRNHHAAGQGDAAMPIARDRSRSTRREIVAALCIPGILLLALTGCAVGPDYRRPDTTTPAAWSNPGATAPAPTSITTPRPVEVVEWWKGFDDPLLASLVERALKSNLDMRLAQARLRQARAARGVVASGLWPQIDASASYRKSGAGGGSSSGQGGSAGTAAPSAGSSTLDLYQIGLDAAWELDIFGGVRRNIEASEADIKAAEEDRRAVLVSLAAEVGTNYVNLRGFQQQLAIARNNLSSQQHTAEITRKRFEAGFVSALDVANARAQAASTASQIPLLESSVQGAIYTLSVLLGLEPAALAGELTDPTAIPPVPPEVPVGLPSELLRRRPDIRRAEAQVHAATARIGVATADLFPKFSLTGSSGLSSGELSSLVNWSSRVWSLGPSVNWPIFSAGRITSNIEVQNALQEQALVTYEQSILTALQEVETALVAYAKEQERRGYLSEETEHNRKAVDLSMKLYVAGRTDFLNVLNAQRSLYVSEEALVLSIRTLTTDLIALYKALGGGWEDAS